ncbi:MAG: site-2 protease family protein, partial [Planctomycetaceae bacterium]
MEPPRRPEETNTARPEDLVIVPESVELIDERGERHPAASSPHPTPEQRRVRQVRSRPKVALALFIATCLSTFFVGAVAHAGLEPTLGERLVDGLIYSAAVMGILLSHEMGHYLQARRYHVPASWPYFLPMPFTPLGTLGAVILQGAGVADRKQTFDIAISGPLAGLVVALPIAWFGVQQADVVDVVNRADFVEFGDPLLIQWMVEIIHGPLPEGKMLPPDPLAFAGWVGIFVTALNLIPIGQLDGGHMLYT